MTASLLLPLYDYEVLAAPFVMAAPAEQASRLTQERVSSYLLYTPQGGETLAEVAQRFGVPEASLADLQARGASYGWSDRVWLVPKTLSGERCITRGT
ncbi:hypothetical protein [Pseudomonas sp. NPDC086251]|uniref:hypothetical protein n=1 Tax=Pseudomonas sp. NPDC086251 TaxID=3364431 RepID=UPI0038361DC1